VDQVGVMKMCPDCGVDIPALNIRCDPCHWKWYGAHVGGQAPTAQPASVPEAEGYYVAGIKRLFGMTHDEIRHAIGAPWPLPDTAQRILDLGRTQPQQPAPVVHKPQQAAASDGIGRAVANLTRRDDAFMPCAADYQP
jgi:hypothetical protein